MTQRGRTDGFGTVLTMFATHKKQSETFRSGDVFGSGLESGKQLCRGVAQPGSAPALGAGGQEFKSPRPDQQFSNLPFRNLRAYPSFTFELDAWSMSACSQQLAGLRLLGH